MSFLDSLKHNLFPPKNPEEITKKITENIADSAFEFFKKPEFRNLVNFDKLSRTEQDRIFNEIVITGLSLAVLMFEGMEGMAKKESPKQFYREMQIEMASRYGNWLKEIGTPLEFTDLWKKLIQMRVDEYRKDYQEHRKKLEKDWKKNPWVFVAALGGYHHIRRGKGKPDDILFKMVLKWVIKNANKIGEDTVKSLG